MVAFLSPAWLLALGALMVPVVIHLWSRRAGRVTRVGSIRFLLASPPARSQSLLLSDRGLLVLRLGILTSLVLALAGLYCTGSPGPHRRSAWALVAPEVLRDSSVLTRVLLDSLRTTGWDLRMLAAGFPAIHDYRSGDHADPPICPSATERPSGAAGDPAARESFRAPLRPSSPWEPQATRPRGSPLGPLCPSLWSLLRDADSRQPPGGALLVVAPNRVAWFRGDRPVLASAVSWRDVPVSSQGLWIAGGWVGVDSVRVLLGRGGGVTTSYGWAAASIHDLPVRLAQPRAMSLSIKPNPDGQGYRALLEHPGDTTSGDTLTIGPTSPVRVTIYAGADHRQQANRLATALRAMSSMFGLITTLEVRNPQDEVPKEQGADWWIVWLSDRPLPPEISEAVRRGATLLTDSTLAAETEAWRRIRGNSVAERSAWFDDRPIAAAQRAPRRASDASRPGSPEGRKTAGSPMLVLTALLYILERWVVRRRQGRPVA